MNSFSLLARSAFLAVAVASALPGLAQDKAFDPFAPGAAELPLPGAETSATQVQLLAEVETIAAGEPFTVAIKLAHPQGWHSYYVNPGTVGLVLTPNWKLPPGFEVERIAWPTPHISITAGQNTYGYEGTVYHLFTIKPPAQLDGGATVEISAEPSWQICDDLNCVLEPPVDVPAGHTLELPVAAKAATNAAHAEAFAAARAMLPQALPADLSVEISREAGAASLLLSPASVAGEGEIHFFDDDGQLDAQAKPVILRSEEDIRITHSLVGEESELNPDRLSGVLVIGNQGYAIDSEYSRPAAKPVSFGKLLGILGGMFVGGMILNLMPCVFPVIGLKIMGFVQQAGEERRKIAMHGVIFAAGVVLSFWVLAGSLLALREGVIGGSGGASSAEAGWGYWLQIPGVVWALMLVMLLLALNMFGVFEIGMAATGVGGSLAQKQGALGTFFSGVLATVVATPCSAPFLGVALGATFGLPSVTFMLSFTAMALGLAFPYLLLSMFPQLVEKLPRPGPWMESFKQAMSFLLFATAGYLLWVYISQIEVAAMLNVVIGLAAIAAATWIYGRWCVVSRTKRTRTVGFVFAIAFAAFGVKASLPPAEQTLVWEKWSPAAVEDALDEGRPVFVDFTAAWCLTCQVNKKNAYPEKVQTLFEKYRVLLLKADNTKREPQINGAIRALGRAAVPVNVLYIPDAETPQLTTELFSAGYMVDFLNEHLGEGASAE